MRIHDRVRLGIVGCGEHAAENLLPSIWALTSAEVVAICDVDQDSLKRAADRFPGAKQYADFSSLIQTEQVHAIIAAATPQVHYQVALESLGRGIHVFVEKPPAVTTSELSRLASLAQRQQLITGVGHNLRHAPISQQLQKVLSNNKFGRRVFMDMQYFASKPFGNRWGLTSPTRSFLLSHVVHAIDFMVFQMGPARLINSEIVSTEIGKMVFSGQFRFGDKAVGTILVTTVASHFSLYATIVSDQGTTMRMDGLNNVSVQGQTDDEKRWGRYWVERTLSTGFEHAGYQCELDIFLKAVKGEAEMHPSFEDELAVYGLLDAIEVQHLDNS